VAHHSRAPWHGNERLAGHVRTIWSDDGTFVAAVVHPDIPTAPLDEQEANGRLLIAAPDLLAACKRYQQFIGTIEEAVNNGPEAMDAHYDTMTAVFNQARAAIAKAEGREE